MLFERFPYSIEEILRKLAPVLGPEYDDLILIALDRDRREDGMVDGCARLRISEGGAALTPIMVIPDDGSPDEPGFEPSDEAEEEPDEAPCEESHSRGRDSRPFANIHLPADLIPKSFPYPMVLEENRTFDGVTVLFGDGGSAADIVYINSGKEPVKADGEKLAPGEFIRVRSPKHLKDTDSRSEPERMRENRKKGEALTSGLLLDTRSRLAACWRAMTRYLDLLGMPEPSNIATLYIYDGDGELKDLLREIENRMRTVKLPRRLSGGELARCRASLAAGLFAVRVASDEIAERLKEQGEAGAQSLARSICERVLKEYLKVEDNGDILLMLLDKLDLLALI